MLLERRPTAVIAPTHIENQAPASHIHLISMALPGAVALRMTIHPQPTGFDRRLPTSLPKLISRSSPMADKKNNAQQNVHDVIHLSQLESPRQHFP